MIGARFDEVLADAQSGDDPAVAALWRDLQPSLLRYARAGGPDSAEDITSEVWLEVARGLHAFRGGESDFRAWVFTIARHRLIDQRRKASRRRETAAAWLPDRAGGRDCEADALASIATADALAVLGDLPPAQAEVVLLRVVADLDVADVARIVGKRPGTVRVLQHRGLRTLAGRLGARRAGAAAATRAL